MPEVPALPRHGNVAHDYDGTAVVCFIVEGFA